MDTKRRTDLVPFQWGPLGMFEELESIMNDRTMGPGRFWVPSMLTARYNIPAIDLREEENRYVLNADLPGLSKEEIDIEIGDGAIDITAKKERSEEEEREGFIRKERGSMYFHRRLDLPDDVDLEAISAKLTDGVLEMVMPKTMRSETRTKKVEVQ